MLETITNLWLDDVRPAPEGWVWCKTTREAREVLMSRFVVEASLDHDLGMDVVVPELSDEARETLAQFGDVSGVQLPWEDDGKLLLRAMELVRNGAHREDNGYTFVKWMKKENKWPALPPRVHSANPDGARNMRAVIEEHWRRVEVRVAELVQTWKEETALLSSSMRMFSHPAYRAVINLGAPVVPLLLHELKVRPGHWHLALSKVTKENPDSQCAPGSVAALTSAWLRWGEARGLV